MLTIALSSKSMTSEQRSRKLLESPTDMKNKKVKKISISLIWISKITKTKETLNKFQKLVFIIEANPTLVLKKSLTKMLKARKI